LAARLTRSRLATRPEQPPAVKMCKFPPLVFTRWVRSLAVNFTLPSKAPPPVPSITKPHPAPAALISRWLTEAGVGGGVADQAIAELINGLPLAGTRLDQVRRAT